MQTAKFTDMPQGSPLSLLHKLSQEHSLYDRRLETLQGQGDADGTRKKMEEVRLKKLKLAVEG